jgi:CDP-alcohol phosphatidyltransferase.
VSPTYGERVAAVRAGAQRRTANLYDTYFTRRVSAYLTALLLPYQVSPNLVSALNIAIGLALCSLIAFGDRPLVLLGALLFHLYSVLDSVDGELARALGRCSLRGMFLENWSAYLQINAFGLAVGAHLLRAGGGVVPLGLALLAAVFGRCAAPVTRRVVLEVLQKRSPAETLREPPAGAARPPVAGPPAAKGGGASWLRRFVEESLLYQTNIWLVLSSLLVIEAIFPALALWLVFPAFLFYTLGALVKEAGIVWLALATPYLDDEVSRVAGPRSVDPPAGS